jgi:hypothetical protein
VNEADLFHAYRKTRMVEEEGLGVMRAEDRARSTKCVVESCLTMISDHTGRVVCRFHQRQLRGAT